MREDLPQFDARQEGEFLFTGEMVYPWMLEQYPTLAPLREAGELLAHKEDWPALYDREALSRNRVPLACVQYHDDMYVDLDLAKESLAGIPNSALWITNAYEHDGIQVDGERIVDRLMGMFPVVED